MECRVRDEGQYWDFKQLVELRSPVEKAELARDVLAFSNWRGGALIYGITDDYKVVGVPKSSVIDTASLREKIQQYTGSEIGLFQGTIPLPDRNKCVWIVFVQQRSGSPLSTQKGGPDKNRKPLFSKGDYFIRQGDQTKRCVDAFDLERLFSNASFTHLQAYQYSVDEPYYRLLAPHTDLFVGREQVISDILEALESRHPVVALDGVGGVGKSAIAIELARRLYRQESVFPIICVSAKNKVWTMNTASRQAGFSGLGELLQQIANVMQLSIPAGLDALKEVVIENLEGVNGLLLVDNMEEVSDPAVIRFLSREVPSPMKVLVTSRVDKGLGGITISVPEMSDDEARSLLRHELERLGYTKYVDQQAHVNQVIEVTGRLPLAIKWAAALADQKGDLGEAVRLLRGSSGTKAEFLNFCFATMYESLSLDAKAVAQLCPYLGVEWNTSTIAIALDIPMRGASASIAELQARGIVMASEDGLEASRLLPFTIDFLRDKWHENKTLRSRVDANLSNALAVDDTEGLLFRWPEDQKLEFLESAVNKNLEDRDYEKAERLIELALHIRSKPQLQYLAGRVELERGRRTDGLKRMELAYRMSIEDGASTLDKKHVAHLAGALLKRGSQADEDTALALVLDCLDEPDLLAPTLLHSASRTALQVRNLRFFTKLFQRLVESRSYDLLYESIFPVSESLVEHAVAIHIGPELTTALSFAALSDKNTPSSARRLQELEQLAAAVFRGSSSAVERQTE